MLLTVWKVVPLIIFAAGGFWTVKSLVRDLAVLRSRGWDLDKDLGPDQHWLDENYRPIGPMSTRAKLFFAYPVAIALCTATVGMGIYRLW